MSRSAGRRALVTGTSSRRLWKGFATQNGSSGLSCFTNDGAAARQETPHVHLHVFGRASDRPANPFEMLARRLGTDRPPHQPLSRRRRSPPRSRVRLRKRPAVLEVSCSASFKSVECCLHAEPEVGAQQPWSVSRITELVAEELTIARLHATGFLVVQYPTVEDEHHGVRVPPEVPSGPRPAVTR
jgi:hypothetical protein